MARPWSRKRREAANEGSDPTEDVRLDTDDHAWWAQADVDRAWTPKARQMPAPDDDAGSEILAEHFGDEQAVGGDRIRVINAAYQELRIRRGK